MAEYCIQGRRTVLEVIHLPAYLSASAFAFAPSSPRAEVALGLIPIGKATPEATRQFARCFPPGRQPGGLLQLLPA